MDKSQIEELRKLKTLLNEGIITKEEFIESRDHLLQSYSKNEKSSIPVQDERGTSNDAVESSQTVILEEKEEAAVAVNSGTNKNGHELSNTNTEPAKSEQDKKYRLIIVGVIGIIALVAGIMAINSYLKAESARKALPGVWVYHSSYKRDSDDSYDAKLDSSMNFSDNGNVQIRIDDCVCNGKWKVQSDGEYLYVRVTDYTITGQSDDMEQIIDNLSYEEYSDGANLYWYVWDGEHTTDWHYYKKIGTTVN